MITQDDILKALAGLAGPDGKTPLTETGMIAGAVAREGKAYVSLSIDPGDQARMEPLRKKVEDALKALPGSNGALVMLTAERAPGASSAPQPGPKAQAQAQAQAARSGASIPGVKHIVAVASGKGGVGKSTTSANLALGLAAMGLKVGVLDADIYGPSMPRLFNLRSKPELTENRIMKPLEAHGLKIMSIGFLVEEETPMIWRGPMVMSAITQMLREVAWGELDVLVVDMPPGTGDAQLTMAQAVPMSGAVIVSTPQDLSLIDARRGLAMFQRVNVPVLGIIENMSYFVCPHCGGRSDIFAHGGARHEAQRLGLPFLGEVPLHMTIRETSDAGLPVVATQPDGPHAAIYKDIARQVWASVSGGAVRSAPRIVIE